jgi:diguanylate cyclase (GGDEF)-like protein
LNLMPDQTLIEDPAAIDALNGLLGLARTTAEAAPLRRVLEAAGEAIAISTGFRLVYISVYRPECNDYGAMFVHGRPELSPPEPSLPPIPRDFLARLPETPVQRAPGIYFVAGTRGMWDGDPNFYPSRTPEAEGPDAWRTEDLLLILLEDVDGEPLGLLSVDEPISRLRPTDGEVRLLRAICLYVEQALRTAKRTRQNAEHTRMLARLSEISPQMSECLDRRELYRLLGDTITADLGFERVAVYSVAGGERLQRVYVRGWESRELLPEQLSAGEVRAMLTGDVDRSGTWLVSACELFGSWGLPRSRRNGRGPLAWHDHCLLVPWFDEHGGELAGIVIAEDPVDRLLPRDQRRYSLRLLVDLAASIEQTITQRARLDRLASRDTLTGLRNRRGLHELIGQTSDCTVMVCDLDDFKQINDRYGHGTGDLVLARFAEILREQTREADTAVRLGGDEFCVVLVGSDDGGVLASERICAATPISMQELVPMTVTVSVGLAQRTNGVPSPRALLTAADAALYSAKQHGRDRTVIAGQRVAQ